MGSAGAAKRREGLRMTERRVRFGMLTPSSNTVLEPVTARMVADAPGVTAHFSRFRVTEIALSDAALGQFDAAPILDAADLLSHAKTDVIAWNGTSASWLGFDRDEALCAAIEARTGVAARTAVLGFRDVFRRAGAARIGLVTPYTADVQARIAANWGAEGLAVAAERHAGLSDNFSFAEVPGETIAEMIRAVAAEGAEAVAVVCTNMNAAGLAAGLEAETGVSVYDSVAVTLWACMEAAGRDMAALAPWGRLFADPQLAA
jgi:maleate isomerase